MHFHGLWHRWYADYSYYSRSSPWISSNRFDSDCHILAYHSLATLAFPYVLTEAKPFPDLGVTIPLQVASPTWPPCLRSHLLLILQAGLNVSSSGSVSLGTLCDVNYAFIPLLSIFTPAYPLLSMNHTLVFLFVWLCFCQSLILYCKLHKAGIFMPYDCLDTLISSEPRI